MRCLPWQGAATHKLTSSLKSFAAQLGFRCIKGWHCGDTSPRIRHGSLLLSLFNPITHDFHNCCTAQIKVQITR